MKTSVAMATYNGEKYILEQLESIRNQSVKIDEVIICDDCSNDDTADIITSFIKLNALTNWKLVINESNKGFVDNFIDCFKLTTGNIVFFSDQDDIWDRRKVELLVDIFKKNANAKAVSCGMKLINKNGEIFKTIESRYKEGNGILKEISFPEQVRDNRSCGCTLAVKNEFFKELIPLIYKYSVSHDLIVGLVASIFEGYYILGQPLVYRRLHDNNTSNVKYSIISRLSNLNFYVKGKITRITLMELCFQEYSYYLTKRDAFDLKEAIIRMRQSIIHIKNKHFLPLLNDVFSNNPMINKKVALFNIFFT